jgi:hypothetical protein
MITKTLLTLDDKTKSFLKNFNLGAGILHLFQGIAMLLLANEATRTIYTSLPEVDTVARRTTPVIEAFADLRLGPIIASFLFMSALAHFLLVAPKIHTWYLNNLERKMNIARWYEYAISSSVMIFVVSILCGMTDIAVLILIFVLNACMNLFGLMMEKYNSAREQLGETRTDWSAYIFGVIAGITPWLVLGTYFYVTVTRVGDVVDIPDFVYWIFWILMISFQSFAINMFLQYIKIGPWKNYIFGEKAYIVLSLVAKSVLAWFIFGGTLR